MPSTLITADIGGTNARLQLWRVAADADVRLVYRATYRPSSFASLLEVLERFAADAARAQAAPTYSTSCHRPS